MTRLPFIDAHIHLWDRERLRYPWLDDPAMASIASDYGIADYRAETAAWNVIAAVHVEAGAHAEDCLDETLWLEEVRAADGWPTALVAHAALDASDLDQQLEWQAARPAMRGIRHIVNWHPDPTRCAYPHDLTINPDWQRGYAMLADHGLSYDFHGHPNQFAALAEAAARHPKVPLIINHLGLPNPQDGLTPWREGLKLLAALPQAHIKISGAGFISAGSFTSASFDAAASRDIILETVDIFTPARSMIASNFPTDRLFTTLDETLTTYAEIFANFSEADQRDLWGRTANRVYRLGLEI